MVHRRHHELSLDSYAGRPTRGEPARDDDDDEVPRTPGRDDDFRLFPTTRDPK